MHVITAELCEGLHSVSLLSNDEPHTANNASLHVLFSEFLLLCGWPYFVVLKVMGCHWWNCWGVSNYCIRAGILHLTTVVIYIMQISAFGVACTSSVDFLGEENYICGFALWPQLELQMNFPSDIRVPSSLLVVKCKLDLASSIIYCLYA